MTTCGSPTIKAQSRVGQILVLYLITIVTMGPVIWSEKPEIRIVCFVTNRAGGRIYGGTFPAIQISYGMYDQRKYTLFEKSLCGSMGDFVIVAMITALNLQLHSPAPAT